MTQETGLAVSNYDKIKALARNKTTIERFQEMLGSKSDAMSYISSAMLAVANSDALMECTPSSIFNTVMRAAALRLSCDPSLRQAHIVPFYNSKKGKREAQFIPGYIGLNNLAQRTGKYRYLQAHELYEGQILEVNQLTGEPQLHGRRESDKVLGYYHYFELFNGFKHVLYMSVEELKAHGAKYAPKNPMWNTNFHDMAKKTVTRLHLLKDGILDPFDRTIIAAASEDIEGNIAGDTIDGTFTDQDDEQAAHEAVEKQAEAKPKVTEAQIMSDLFGDEKPAEKAPEPAVSTNAETPVTPVQRKPAAQPAGPTWDDPEPQEEPTELWNPQVLYTLAQNWELPMKRLVATLKYCNLPKSSTIEVMSVWMANYKAARDAGQAPAIAAETANAA